MKELVQFGVRHHARKSVELAVLHDLPGRLHEGVHSDARHGAADADAAYAERSKIADRVAERTAVEKVDGLRGDGLDGGFNLFARFDSGRIETIGSGVGESLQATDRLVEIRTVVNETLRACGEHDVATRFVDCVRVALTRLSARSKS